jgi:uncharacterized OB-fold protein
MSTAEAKRFPIVEGLLSIDDDKPYLIGSRCKTCGAHYFPRAFSCNNPKCDRGEVEEVALSEQGTIYSYTIQYYQPPPPYKFDGDFAPYAIGLVELPEGIRILSQLSGIRPEEFKIGMTVAFTTEKQFTDDEGNEYISWKFKKI